MRHTRASAPERLQATQAFLIFARGGDAAALRLCVIFRQNARGGRRIPTGLARSNLCEKTRRRRAVVVFTELLLDLRKGAEIGARGFFAEQALEKLGAVAGFF